MYIHFCFVLLIVIMYYSGVIDPMVYDREIGKTRKASPRKMGFWLC